MRSVCTSCSAEVAAKVADLQTESARNMCLEVHHIAVKVLSARLQHIASASPESPPVVPDFGCRAVAAYAAVVLAAEGAPPFHCVEPEVVDFAKYVQSIVELLEDASSCSAGNTDLARAKRIATGFRTVKNTCRRHEVS